MLEFLNDLPVYVQALSVILPLIYGFYQHWQKVRTAAAAHDLQGGLHVTRDALNTVVAILEQAKVFAPDAPTRAYLQRMTRQIRHTAEQVGVESEVLAPAVQQVVASLQKLFAEAPEKSVDHRRIVEVIREANPIPRPAAAGRSVIDDRIAARRLHSGKHAAMKGGLFCLLAIGILLSGCALVEPTVGQRGALESLEDNQRLTPELAGKTTDLQINHTIIEEIDPDTGQVVRRTTETRRTRGLPVVPGRTRISISDEFADADQQVSSTRDAIGSELQLNRVAAGNADTLAVSGQVQTIRGEQQSQLASQLVETATNGLVSINRDNRQAEVERTRLEVNRDIELSRITSAEEEESPEDPASDAAPPEPTAEP